MHKILFATLFAIFFVSIIHYADAARGDIDDAVTEVFVFSGATSTPRLVQIDSNTFGVIFQGTGSSLRIETFEVDSGSGDVSSGAGSEEVIIDANGGAVPDVVVASDGILAIVYGDADSGADGNDGKVVTIAVDSTGDVTDTGGTADLVDTETYDTQSGSQKIVDTGSNNDFLILFEGADDDGFLELVDITDVGAITLNVDTVEFFDATTIDDEAITAIDSDTFLIASFDEGGNITRYKTIDVSGGDITNTVTETFTLENSLADHDDHSSIVQVDSNTFVIAYDENDDGIRIRTIDVAADGTGMTIVDTLDIDEGNDADWPELLKIEDGTSGESDLFAVIYADPADRAVVQTFTIDDTGNISDSVIDEITLEGPSSNVDTNPHLIAVDSDTLIATYAVGGSGRIVSFDIDNPSATSSTEKSGSSTTKLTLLRPTFGLDHNTYQMRVEGGFSFNGESFDITNNYWTDFPEQQVNVGETNSFTAKVFTYYPLRVQEFLFGIPEVGNPHNAELGVAVHYDHTGEVNQILVDQKTPVIDIDSALAMYGPSECQEGSGVKECNTTTLIMNFLEPLKDKVMAIHAIDYQGHTQITYLNEGFYIVGDSLNPMKKILIPTHEKYEGLVEVTQTAKYSPIWVSEDGREFYIDETGYAKQINKSYTRHTDTGKFDRTHSEFYKLHDYTIRMAEDKLAEICPTCLIEHNNLQPSESTTFYESPAKLQDPLVLQKMQSESDRAQQYVDELFEYLYDTTHGDKRYMLYTDEPLINYFLKKK